MLVLVGAAGYAHGGADEAVVSAETAAAHTGYHITQQQLTRSVRYAHYALTLLAHTGMFAQALPQVTQAQRHRSLPLARYSATHTLRSLRSLRLHQHSPSMPIAQCRV